MGRGGILRSQMVTTLGDQVATPRVVDVYLPGSLRSADPRRAGLCNKGKGQEPYLVRQRAYPHNSIRRMETLLMGRMAISVWIL